MKKIASLLVFLTIIFPLSLYANTEIPFEYDYKINTLKVIHDGADVIVIYDLDTYLIVAKTAVDALKGSQAIWLDAQLEVKNQSGMVFALIEGTLKAVQSDSKFKLEGKYRVNYMSNFVGDQVSGELLVKNARMVDPDIKPKRETTRPSVPSCWSLGYRYGKCVTRVSFDLKCQPQDDFVMPERCRGKPETQRGIKEGVREVYQSLGIPFRR
jgi:hypothetical protein